MSALDDFPVGTAFVPSDSSVLVETARVCGVDLFIEGKPERALALVISGLPIGDPNIVVEATLFLQPQTALALGRQIADALTTFAELKTD